MIRLGTPNQWDISSMNSAAIAEVVANTGLTSIHLVKLSIAMNTWLNPSTAVMRGPTELSPQQAKGQVGWIVHKA